MSANAVRVDDGSNVAVRTPGDHLVPPEDMFRIKNLSEYHRRKYLKAQNVALFPPTSQTRFRSSFQESKAPDWLKQRFKSLYDDNRSHNAVNPSSSSDRPPDERDRGVG